MKSRLRVLGSLVGGSTAVLLLAVLGVQLAVHHSKSELMKYQDELESRGEQLSPAAFESHASASNPGTMEFAEAFKELKKHETLRNLPIRHEGNPSMGAAKIKEDRAVVLHQQPALRRDKQNLPWKELARYLEPVQPQLETIRQLASTPVQPLDSWSFLPGQAGNFFKADTVMRLRRNDIQGAVANVETLLRLAQLSGEYAILPRLLPLILDAEFCTWETLQVASIEPADLLRLQDAWQAMQPGETLRRTLRVHRALAAWHLADSVPQSISRTRSSSAFLRPWLISSLVDTTWALFFRYSDELEFLSGFQQILDLMPPDGGLSYPTLLTVATQRMQPLAGREISRGASLGMSQHLTGLISESATADTIRALAITAIAIRRYQLDHTGTLPATLDRLVPDYLTGLPPDPLSGKDLRYQPEADGFLLYSVGLDGKDDAGSTAFMRSKIAGQFMANRLDIVWPRPATAGKFVSP